jgi:hypothetical protein
MNQTAPRIASALDRNRRLTSAMRSGATFVDTPQILTAFR